MKKTKILLIAMIALLFEVTAWASLERQQLIQDTEDSAEVVARSGQMTCLN